MAPENRLIEIAAAPLALLHEKSRVAGSDLGSALELPSKGVRRSFFGEGCRRSDWRGAAFLQVRCRGLQVASARRNAVQQLPSRLLDHSCRRPRNAEISCFSKQEVLRQTPRILARHGAQTMTARRKRAWRPDMRGEPVSQAQQSWCSVEAPQDTEHSTVQDPDLPSAVSFTHESRWTSLPPPPRSRWPQR